MAKAYGDRVKTVAKDMECLIVDAFSLLGGDHIECESHYGHYLEDGLHLNELGNKRLYGVSSSWRCFFFCPVNILITLIVRA